MAAKRSRRIGLHDRLGQLTYRAACRLMADGNAQEGEERLRSSTPHSIDLGRDVTLGGDTLRVRVQDYALPEGFAVVSIVEMTSKPQGLHLECDRCEGRCDHVAAAVQLVLNHKLELGLSAPPDPGEPLELLTEDELVQRALADRRKRAATERMRLRSLRPETPWADYTITSLESGGSYRVSLRGFEPGESYCSCPDFRTNHLGTCKHIMHAIAKVEKRFSREKLQRPYRRRNLSLRLDYGSRLGLRFNLPAKLDPDAAKRLGPLKDALIEDVAPLPRLLRSLERAGHDVHVYPDAEEFIEQRLLQQRLAEAASEIRHDPASHPLRQELLQAELLPYQLDGIAFAVGAGRSVLADEMGLGKTIQAIGVAELLAQLAGIRRVLVVCPASLKSQWRSEIHRFCKRECQIVLGPAAERVDQYRSDCFFTICNYEQVIRDHSAIEAANWDLVILDEGQRIKNWESKTSRMVGSLKSTYALVLSGTPLENRLEELYTVVSFIDDRRLGPAYRFLHRHRMVTEEGKVEGYRNLDELRERLKPLLLRRTRDQVMKELPPRTTDIVRIRPTEEQFELSEQHVRLAVRIARKRFLTEMDLLMLQKHLLVARMACDSTFLVDKEPPGYSSKLKALGELLGQLGDTPDAKIVLFSEWTKMLDLIEPLMKRAKLPFVRLEGKVPQGKRQQLVKQFQSDPKCRAILMTNAGSTGLNLQAANTVINVDLPWNPAVLEQRIARAHRMGQQQPVQVYVLVTEDTIEERMLGTLSAKHDLAMAALDVESEVSVVELQSGMEQLRRRLEVLLGTKPATPVDASEQRAVDEQAQRIVAKRESVASAGGELLGAAMRLVGELVGDQAPAQPEVVEQVRSGLSQCADRTEDGRLNLRLTLPNDEALQALAASLAKLLVAKPD